MSQGFVKYWRLGLFVLVSLLAAAGIAVWLGSSQLSREGHDYVTYFADDASGLQPGGAVRYRGVAVGDVQEIRIAPRGRRVEVRMTLWEEQLSRLGVDAEGTPPDELRAKLDSGGITGDTRVSLEFVEPGQAPPPQLSFRPEGRYVPAWDGTYRGVRDAAQALAGDLELAVKDARALMRSAREDFEGLQAGELGARAREALEATERAAAEVPETARQVAESGQAVEAAAARVDRLSGEASVTLRELQRTVSELRDLIELLERDPGALVRGRVAQESRR